jgi:ABC-type nickel/cobalt efflux system permease component RcnA
MRGLSLSPALILTLAILALAAGVYLAGGDRALMIWALEGQREAQNALAGGLRALRAGEAAALAGFLAVAFGYGFFHAVGPGHGKLLIGGYGLGGRLSAARLSGIALISSLGQAATAIALVAAGVWALAWSRERMTASAEAVFAPLSFAAVAAVGLWLLVRGVAAWRRARAARAAAGQGTARAAGGEVCGGCGHVHGPDPAALAQAADWREAAALIGAVAIRPCTGALFILILTAQMGIFWIGIAGALAMALGTAAVTVATALAATAARHGLLSDLGSHPAFGEMQAAVQIAVGGLVAGVAGRIALAAL